ncbi:MAG TPA: efflux RND transporter permease subunit [bacterium (Candidatus Stahlbacteria)]|nr:efflux RND transporter permease subunit [Candidatus Stahlbacteria bacterium]
MWNLAIRRPVTFTMLYLAIVGIGIVCLTRLSPELLPDVSMPVAAVITTYSGAGPEDIENLVTRPIEEAVATVTNVSEITSIVREGRSTTLLEFKWGTNMDMAAADIREKVDLIRKWLPEDVERPLVIKFDPTMMPIMMITLSGELPSWELRRIAEDEVSPRIERIEGVASAMPMGGLKREIQVNLDRRRLEAYGVSVNQVIGALRTANLTYPGGSVGLGERDYIVRTQGEFESVDEIGDVVVSYANGAPIRIRDIAEVKDGFEERLTDTRINGKPGIAIMVHKTSGAVTVDVSNRIKKELSRIEKELPPGVTTGIVMDQSKFINKALGNIVQVAIIGVILAVLMLFGFLFNLRSTSIIALVIPISVIGTFVAMYALDITLNIIAMMGLALAIGMLVDSAIVVLENVFRHREEGMEMKEAASFGTGEVAIPIIASILTTVSVFLPIIFIPGMIGIMFRDLSLTVTVSLLVSLFVALTLIPLLCSRFLKLRKEEKGTRWNWIGALEDKVRPLFRSLDSVYTRWLNWCLNHKRIVVFGTVVLFFLSVFMVWPLRFVGTEWIPKIDQGMLTIAIELPPGTKLETTEQVVKQVEDIIKEEVPEAEIIESTIGGEAMAAMLGGGGRTYKAEVNVELVDIAERARTQWDIEEAIRCKLVKIPGAMITFGSETQRRMMIGMGGGAPISIEIYGYDIDEASKFATQVEDIVKKVRGTRDVKVSLEKARPEFNVLVDRDKASALGLPVAFVADAISSTVKGKVATRFREGGDEFNVKVRLREKDRRSFEDLANIPISTPMGKQVTLSNIADVKPTLGPLTIERKGQERLVTVTCDYVGRDLGGVVREIDKKLSALTLPPDFSIKIGGEAKEQQESFKWLALALIGAVFLVYMVMASLFESLRDPFIVMLTFPMAAIGVIWMLFFTNTTFSVIAFVGLIMLAGIIVNNGIVMVHYISLLRRRDKLPLREAVVLGGRRRVRPVLMTALTTIFAMIPMALGLGTGAELRMPMARAVVGGLIVGTFLTLFLVPVLYTVLETIGLRRKQI